VLYPPVYFAIFPSSQPGIQFCISVGSKTPVVTIANDKEFRVLDIGQRGLEGNARGRKATSILIPTMHVTPFCCLSVALCCGGQLFLSAS
jgi:hypothetical protein